MKAFQENASASVLGYRVYSFLFEGFFLFFSSKSCFSLPSSLPGFGLCWSSPKQFHFFI